MTLIKVFYLSTSGNDVWGWKGPDGTQYAIMGTRNGVAIVNVNTLTLADTVLGTPCIWRDMKTYRNYLYVASECEGIRIIDLSPLPGSVRFVGMFIGASDT